MEPSEPRGEPSVPVSKNAGEETSPEILAKAAEGLDDLFSGDEDSPKRISPKESDSKLEDDELEDEDEDEEELEATGDPEPENKDEGKKGTEDEYDIPEAYLRSATEHSFSKEDIVSMIKDNGEKATEKFLKSLHTKANQQSAWFADAGRRMKELEQQQQNVPVAGSPGQAQVPGLLPVPGQAQVPNLSPEEVRSYEAEHGPDDPLLRVYKQQSQLIGDLNTQLNDVSSRLSAHDTDLEQRDLNRKADEAKQVVSFFRGEEIKPYTALYGELAEDATTWEDLPLAHRVNRDKVLEITENIMLGAQFKGQNVTLDDALGMAHRIVSEPMAAVVAHDSIIKSVEKRHKTRVIRPSNSKGTGEPVRKAGEPLSDAAVIERAKQRLAKTFGG